MRETVGGGGKNWDFAIAASLKSVIIWPIGGLTSHPFSDINNEAEPTKATKMRLMRRGRGGREKEAKKGGKMRETNTMTNRRKMADKNEMLRQKTT